MGATIDSRESILSKPGVFAIPFYGDQERSIPYFQQMLDGLFAQTDDNWIAVVVDDATPSEPIKAYLRDVQATYPEKIQILRLEANRGQGICRNIVADWAYQRELPILLYHDADDISHPDRMGVTRATFAEHPDVDVLYSGFVVIDEHSQIVPDERITPSVREIIEANTLNPVEGSNTWIEITTVTGFTCLPSATAARTSLAKRCPVPDVRVSEDSYLWIIMSAAGNAFKYTPAIPSLYRLPSDKSEGSSHRTRVGRKRFYAEKALVDTDAFLAALQIALERGTIHAGQVGALKAMFFQRLAETLAKEHEPELAALSVDTGGNPFKESTLVTQHLLVEHS